jgi:hypothetical protein
MCRGGVLPGDLHVNYANLQHAYHEAKLKEQRAEGKDANDHERLRVPLWEQRGVLPFGDAIVTVVFYEEVNDHVALLAPWARGPVVDV